MTVGHSAGNRLAGDRAIGADPVLHDERLLEGIGEMLRGDARHAVGIAAGGVGHEDADRPLRPVLRLHGWLGGKGQHNREQRGDKLTGYLATHCKLLDGAPPLHHAAAIDAIPGEP